MTPKAIAVLAFLIFALGGAVALWLVHRTESKARLEQLVTNRYGEMDPVLCAFWLGIGTLVWTLIWCALKGKVPEGLAGIYGPFALTVVAPLIAKVVFKAKSPPSVPPEREA